MRSFTLSVFPIGVVIGLIYAAILLASVLVIHAALSGRIASRGVARTQTVSASAGLELTPHSRLVGVGKSYRFQLCTHCGVEYAVDFDAALWDLADLAWRSRNGNPPPGIGSPYQAGTMTLVDTRHARFDFSGGSIAFVRHVGPKLVPGPCS